MSQNPFELAIVRLVAARRAKASSLAARKALDYTCEREKQVDPEDEARKQEKACWKVTLIHGETNDLGRQYSADYWEYEGGTAEDDDGDHAALWCTNCQKRQVAYLVYRQAIREHGAASRVFWTLAYRVARRSSLTSAPGAVTP